MANEYQYVYILFIVLLFVLLRTRSQAKGRKINAAKIFRRPVLYSLFTLLLLVSTPTIIALAASLLFWILGYKAGLVFGPKAKVYAENGIIRSKSSNEIFAIWTVSFVARLFIELAFPIPSAPSVVVPNAYFWYLAIDLLLAFSAGMLLGEARHIYKMYKSIKNNGAGESRVS